MWESQPNNRPARTRSATRTRTAGLAALRFASAMSDRTSDSVRPAPPPGRSIAETSWRGTSLKMPWTTRSSFRNSSRGTRTLCGIALELTAEVAVVHRRAAELAVGQQGIVGDHPHPRPAQTLVQALGLVVGRVEHEQCLPAFARGGFHRSQ